MKLTQEERRNFAASFKPKEKGITYKMYTDFSRALVKEWDPNIDGDFESRYSGIN